MHGVGCLLFAVVRGSSLFVVRRSSFVVCCFGVWCLVIVSSVACLVVWCLCGCGL